MIKTIKDFNEHDKIALPAVKVSSQAICLQMAAAKEWGQDQYAKLDPFTITRPHPDAAASVMSKATEVNCHYSVAPYYYLELATPGVHRVLKSYDTLGGPATNGVMIMSKKFRDANPKVTGAVFAALSEAEDFINKNAERRRADLHQGHQRKAQHAGGSDQVSFPILTMYGRRAAADDGHSPPSCTRSAP